MNIKIYYGLSGTLKGSTIEATKKKIPGIKIMESSIKPWKYYQFGLFKDLTEYNDLTYGILHMVRLREFMEQNHEEDDLLIERGVTDTLFYYYYNSGEPRLENSEFIRSVVCAEKSLLCPDFSKIERILLVQEDKDFVKDEVLKDEYRKRTFNNDPNLYFDLQEKYVDFTTKYNSIDSVIRINNAKEYVTETLGEHWNK